MNTPLSFDDQRPHGAPPSPPPPIASKGRPMLLVTAVGALLGVLFAGVSTSDFISHLDRQVHSIHCSFIPGAGAEIGESGCRTVMMSPYSSVMRDSMWGGLPISLLAVAVFAYLVMHSMRLFLSGRGPDKNDTKYLLLATALPVVMSLIYSYLAVSKIGAVCKLCVGIYISSGVVFFGALMAHMNADRPSGPTPTSLYARYFGEGVLYVAVLAIFYMLFAPTSPKSEKGCGTLVKKDDGSGIMIPLGKGKGTQAIAVVDPLCPACKGFDDRMKASNLYDDLDLKAVLFPLDSQCNWMVKDSLHPGACAVSEAMLCDKDGAEDILNWAFKNQEELRETAKKDDNKIRQKIESEFPKVKGCLGSPKAKNQVNKSLKWAVANAIPVLTPQLFIDDKRVCDEDTDLGLEYTVTRMLEGKKGRR
jgi:uncharacterized membrane protein